MKKRFTVKTATAIVGVKGTRFLVKTQDKTTQVFLKSGKLTVEAIEGKFRRLVEKTEEEFEETIKKEEREFEEFVKRFEMKSGQSIVIVGQEVKNIEFSKELDREFDLLEDW